MNNTAEIISSRLTKLFGVDKFISLSEPCFIGNEWKYVKDCLDSGWVSSVGSYVDLFEQKLAQYTGAGFCVVTMNGTAALHVALILAGIKKEDEVLVQAMTFVGTVNPICYIGAIPHFVDVDEETLGIDVKKLEKYLEEIAQIEDGYCVNRITGRKIKALIPMHTFGYPSNLDGLKKICDKYRLLLIEDAAEAIGSFEGSKHVGTSGFCGILSFNGNKIITTGGGGALLFNDEFQAKRAKHLTTTAKVSHAYEFVHDEIGFNYRLPNINSALGVAQLEKLNEFLEARKKLYEKYCCILNDVEGVRVFSPRKNVSANHWLITILLDEEDLKLRNEIIETASKNNLMFRPIWRLINTLDKYKHFPCMNLDCAKSLEKRIINIPSSSKLAYKI